MFVLLLTLAVFIQLGSAGHHVPRLHHITTCREIGGDVIRFNKDVPYLWSTCADPNGGNNYRSLRANSCDHCGKLSLFWLTILYFFPFLAELCKLTGGCNYWTWVPHFLEPNGHRHCKLYKNYCCFRPAYPYPYPPYPEKDGSKIRKSGMKFQTCDYSY